MLTWSGRLDNILCRRILLFAALHHACATFCYTKKHKSVHVRCPGSRLICALNDPQHGQFARFGRI